MSKGEHNRLSDGQRGRNFLECFLTMKAKDPVHVQIGRSFAEN